MRDDPKLYNTPNEKNILHPENESYNKLADECIKKRVCVDLFFAVQQNRQIDISSICPLAAKTGGDINLFS